MSDRQRIVEGEISTIRTVCQCIEAWVQHLPLQRVRMARLHEVPVVGNVPHDVEHAVWVMGIAAISGGGPARRSKCTSGAPGCQMGGGLASAGGGREDR